MELITPQTETVQPVDKPFPTTAFLDGATAGQPTPPPSPKKKSNFLAFLMVLLAVVLAGSGFYYYNTFLRVRTPTAEIAALPTPQPLFLTLDSLDQEATVVEGELLVKGKTLPNIGVAIFSDVDETILESDAQGNFQESVVVGENGGLVRVIAYGDNDEEETVTVDVSDQNSVLGKSDSKVNNGKSETAKELIIPSTKTIKTTTETKSKTEKLVKEEKTQEITDFITNKTEVKKVEKLGTKKILSLIAAGSTESAELLSKGQLKKMAVKEATGGAVLKRHAISGVITNIADGVITIAHQIQRDRVNTIYFNTSTVISIKGLTAATGDDLAVGMRIAAVGVPSEDGLLAARIHVIPGKAKGVFEKNPVSVTPTATISASPTVTPTVEPTVTPSPSPTPTP